MRCVKTNATKLRNTSEHFVLANYYFPEVTKNSAFAMLQSLFKVDAEQLKTQCGSIQPNLIQ
jgi:hypothetical protein